MTIKKKVQQEEEEDPNSESVDRISELPKEILHHILGFLEMDEVLIQTSLVSTKWRNLWKYVSTLTFSTDRISRRIGGSVDNGGGIMNNVDKYLNFVDHILRLRDSEASKIQNFKYSEVSGSRDSKSLDKLECVDKFILGAVNQGAQEIHILELHSNQRIHLNPSIFTSGVLKRLKFSVSNSYYRIQFPYSMCCATQLRHLSLEGIILPEGDDSNAELHLVCPVLETLVMRYCCSKHLRVLDISAPRLNTLSICNILMRCRYSDRLGGCRIEIRTPNLTSLDYVGDVYDDCFTENLPCLVNASLVLDNDSDMLEKETLFAIKLLKGLSSAQHVTLEGYEVFSRDILYKEILTPFTSLTTLRLITGCRASNIHGTVQILNNRKSLEGLFTNWFSVIQVKVNQKMNI